MTLPDPRRSPLAATPLGELIAALAEMGVATREGSFRESASRAISASEISERWLETSSPETDDDAQLLREAAVDLWRRWVPERPCAELIAPTLQGLVKQPAVQATAESLQPLASALRTLPGRARDLISALSKILDADIFGWLRDVAKQLPQGTPVAMTFEALFPPPLPTPEPQLSLTVERPRPAEPPLTPARHAPEPTPEPKLEVGPVSLPVPSVKSVGVRAKEETPPREEPPTSVPEPAAVSLETATKPPPVPVPEVHAVEPPLLREPPPEMAWFESSPSRGASARPVSPTEPPPRASDDASAAPNVLGSGSKPAPESKKAHRKDVETKTEARPAPPVPQLVGRNEPCPCGSGKKYKRCHLGKPLPPSAQAAG